MLVHEVLEVVTADSSELLGLHQHHSRSDFREQMLEELVERLQLGVRLEVSRGV